MSCKYIQVATLLIGGEWLTHRVVHKNREWGRGDLGELFFLFRELQLQRGDLRLQLLLQHLGHLLRLTNLDVLKKN